MLTPNNSITEFLLITSRELHSLFIAITVSNSQVPFKQSVINLCFSLDYYLTCYKHVSNITCTCYFALCHLASIYGFLTNTATATHVSAFVLSRIDYCNSLLFGSTHVVASHLQWMQNYAAWVILFIPKSAM